MSTTVPQVYAAINAVQAALAVEGIAKGRKNAQQGYSFRGIDEIYNALAPILAREKLCILPRCLERTVVERETKSGGALFNVTVRCEFDFVSSVDGSRHVVTTYGEAMDSADKATNKAMSAAYKYAALQAFSIPTEGDDNDADASSHDVAGRAAIAREVERAKWIAERIVEIEQAKTVGQLKKVFDAAVAVTRQQADPDAERQLQAAADAKAALAKAKAPTTATQE